jgi:hypothetical protein
VTDDIKQTVVDNADPAALPAADATTSAQEPTLEQLLDEYDRSVQRSSPQPEPTPQLQSQDQQQTPPIDYGQIHRFQQKQFMDEVKGAAAKIFGDLKVPEKAKIGWLDQMAREIPEAAASWQNRHNNPRQWAKWERYLSRAVEAEFKSPVDPVATDDRDAVAAAVRGASTKVTAEPPPSFGHMSNSEFRKSVREKYGFDPGV